MMTLWRRSLALRIFGNVVFGPVSFLIGVVSSNTLSNYTATGNAIAVASFMFFGLWAWWYAEDRDRRAALTERRRGLDDESD